MITDPIMTDDIRYNPATACFEAKVTVHGAGPARVYACEFQGDLSLANDEIQTSLRDEALRRHVHEQGLYSCQGASELRPMHKPQRPTLPRNWFARLPTVGHLRAA